MRSSYDVIVVGGGPAGTAAAITAARSGSERGNGSPSVLLLEQSSFPRQKVCGEFVSAESLDLLRKLLPPAAKLLECAPQIAWAGLNLLGLAPVMLAVTPPAASITRWELDQWLWQAAGLSGADCRERVEVEGIERQNGGFAVITRAGTFPGRSVIDASGRWSRLNAAQVRASANPARQPHRVGLKAHFQGEGLVVCAGDSLTELQAAAAPPDIAQVDVKVDSRTKVATEMYFFPGGYCGVQPLSGGRLNVCAMVESARAANLAELFRLHPVLWERSRGWTQAHETVATAPLIFRTPMADREGVLLSGDAAGFIDPFAGDGISLALRAGALAAESLASFWQGRMSLGEATANYRNEYRKRYARVFRTASVLRRVLSGPQVLQAALLRGLRLPYLAQWAVKGTR